MVALRAAAPRDHPEDYPVHTDSAQAAIGAEFLVHSLPTEKGMLLAGHYLVVETGIYPHPHEAVAISSGQFRLIVNGRQLPDPDSAGAVSASMKYSDWEPRRGMQAGAGAGPIVVGPQQPAGRFPGDPTSPGPVEQPTPRQDPTGAAPYEITVDDLVLHAALPTVTTRQPVDGCLFFHYDGKTSKIRTIELVWQIPDAAPVTLKLR